MPPISHRRRSGPALLVVTILVMLLVGCSPDVAETSPPGSIAGDEPGPVAAAEAVLAAFEDHPLVGGFSASHGNKEVDDFLLGLVRDPTFADHVDDIAIECGNARHQEVLDRYVAGEDVPPTDVQRVWRDTTQVNCGFSSFYEQLIPLVRRVNEKLAPDDRVRVLACDPPIDWSTIEGVADFEAQADRESSISGVLEREVLDQGRSALLLFGINHVRHLPGTAIGMLEDAGHDDVAYVIEDHIGFGGGDPALTAENDELEARMTSWPVPSITPVEGTWLSELDSAYFPPAPGDVGGGHSTGPPGVDAYLYVGPRDTQLRELRAPRALLDDAYLAELEHRARLIGVPPDMPRYPANLLRDEVEAGAFSYDPEAADPGGQAPPPGSEGDDANEPSDPTAAPDSGSNTMTAGG